MEGNPFDVIEEDETGGDEQFSKVFHGYTLFFVPLEIDPRVFQQFYRIWGVHIISAFPSALKFIPCRCTHARLKVKLNCQVDPSDEFPSSSHKVIPS